VTASPRLGVRTQVAKGTRARVRALTRKGAYAHRVPTRNTHARFNVMSTRARAHEPGPLSTIDAEPSGKTESGHGMR